MKVGLALPHYDCSFPDGSPATVARVVEYARRAEAAGLSSVWVSDHLFLDLAKYGGPAEPFGTPEAFVMLAAIASSTQRVRLGPLVLNAALRNPRVLAEQIRSVSDLSGARFDAGLGAGWYEPEFEAAGIPFGTTGGRIAHLAEVAASVRGAGAPVWIGGKGGPKIADIVARHADGWNVVWRMDPATYKQRLDTLREACERHGRDPSSVARSVGLYTLLGTSDDDLAARFERMRAWSRGVLDGETLDGFADGALVGTPQRCAERIREFADLGVDEIILGLAPVPFGVWEDEQLDLAAELAGLVA